MKLNRWTILGLILLCVFYAKAFLKINNYADEHWVILNAGAERYTTVASADVFFVMER
jgi:hypothetical protein